MCTCACSLCQYGEAYPLTRSLRFLPAAPQGTDDIMSILSLYRQGLWDVFVKFAPSCQMALSRYLDVLTYYHIIPRRADIDAAVRTHACVFI